MFSHPQQQQQQFFSDAIKREMAGDYMDDMIASNISKVLIIYAGGTIGMKNTPQHGYLPAQGYLSKVLSGMTRFHDPTGQAFSSGQMERANTTSVMNTPTTAALSLPNTFNNSQGTAAGTATSNNTYTSSNTNSQNNTVESLVSPNIDKFRSLPSSTDSIKALKSPLTNTVHIPIRYPHLDIDNPNAAKFMSQIVQDDEDSDPNNNENIDSNFLQINGTKCIRVKLKSFISPPSLFNKRTRYSILEYDPLLDSSNMTMEDWTKIATDIEVNYQLFDAFIVLHGTDTMSYTASALSFMLEDLGKTVILTGSQIPLSEVMNDAVDNLLGAMAIAAHYTIPEVGLFFGHRLYRGNRTSKVDAYELNAFESPNLRPLVTVGIHIDVSWAEVFRPTSLTRFKAHKVMNAQVATLRLFPGITETTVRAFLSPPISGVVLETYGSGNAPNNRPELLLALKEASDRGVVIVNCTQCKKGMVTDLYATGKALLEVGVVPGSDMTPECALTKLSYLLGKKYSHEECRMLIRSNLRGELTVPSRTTRFTYQRNTLKNISLVLNMLKQGNKSEKFLGNLSAGNASGILLSETDAHSPETADDTNNKYSQIGGGSFGLDRLALNTELCRNTPKNNNAVFSQDSLHSPKSPTAISIYEDELGGLEKTFVPMLMCQAIRHNDLIGLQHILAQFTSLINTGDYDGRTPLHIACSENQYDISKFLLLQGASVHLRDRFGHTPLWDAIHHPSISLVELLVDTGAHFGEEEQILIIPYAVKAAYDGDIEFLYILGISGFNFNLRWADGENVLHMACKGRQPQIIMYLVSNKPLNLLFFDAVDSSTFSPFALEQNQQHTSIHHTQRKGPLVNIDAKNKFGQTAMDILKERHFYELVGLLEKS